MDPAVIAAMISAGTKVGMSLFDRWSGRTDDQKARAFVEKHFDAFRKLTSDNCMRLLKHMEDGQNRTVAELIVHLYPEFKKFPVEEREHLRSEFEYRLFFMSLAGLITRPTRVFYITEAGKAFVNEARKRWEYSKVLFD